MNARFDTEAKCHRRLERLRWPRGVECPSCGACRLSRFRARGKTGKLRRLYTCLACRYQFTVTAGTFMHDSHLPLRKWFAAIFALCPAPYPPAGALRSARGRKGRGSASYLSLAGLRRSAASRSASRPRGPAANRVSAVWLQEKLKLGSYKTAWLLARRIRRARDEGDPLLMKIARLRRRSS